MAAAAAPPSAHSRPTSRARAKARAYRSRTAAPRNDKGSRPTLLPLLPQVFLTYCNVAGVYVSCGIL